MQVGVEEYLGNVYAAAAAVDHDYLGDYVQELVEDVGWYEQLWTDGSIQSTVLQQKLCQVADRVFD